jgi:hypothetical protein
MRGGHDLPEYGGNRLQGTYGGEKAMVYNLGNNNFLDLVNY